MVENQVFLRQKSRIILPYSLIRTVCFSISSINTAGLFFSGEGWSENIKSFKIYLVLPTLTLLFSFVLGQWPKEIIDFKAGKSPSSLSHYLQTNGLNSLKIYRALMRVVFPEPGSLWSECCSMINMSRSLLSSQERIVFYLYFPFFLFFWAIWTRVPKCLRSFSSRDAIWGSFSRGFNYARFFCFFWLIIPPPWRLTIIYESSGRLIWLSLPSSASRALACPCLNFPA